MTLSNYTEEQKTMLDKGFTLCIECKKGYRGDKSCGANGHIDYNDNSSSGCTSGQKLADNDSVVSSKDEAISFAAKALSSYSKLIDIEICIKGQAAIDIEPLFKNTDQNVCPKTKMQEYIKANMPKLEDDIKELVSKIKSKGLLVVKVSECHKEFDPFSQALELVFKGLI